jgi:hypothetical protein
LIASAADGTILLISDRRAEAEKARERLKG